MTESVSVNMRLQKIILIQIAVGILSCSSSVNNSDENNEISRSEKIIYKADYGNDWPFTVDKGVLKCSSNQVLFIVNGKRYAINGTAQGLASSLGYSAVEEIWAYDSAMRQQLLAKGYSRVELEEIKPRISVGRIIQDGLKLCDN